MVSSSSDRDLRPQALASAKIQICFSGGGGLRRRRRNLLHRMVHDLNTGFREAYVIQNVPTFDRFPLLFRPRFFIGFLPITFYFSDSFIWSKIAVRVFSESG
jgi:hypothetical protein